MVLRSENYDVMVIDSGNTALIAALTAQETGSRFLVLGKASNAQRGGMAVSNLAPTGPHERLF